MMVPAVVLQHEHSLVSLLYTRYRDARTLIGAISSSLASVDSFPSSDPLELGGESSESS